MESNYAFHFQVALNFRLCALKMLQLLGDSVPETFCRGSPLDPTAEQMNKTFAADNGQDNKISSVRPGTINIELGPLISCYRGLRSVDDILQTTVSTYRK